MQRIGTLTDKRRYVCARFPTPLGYGRAVFPRAACPGGGGGGGGDDGGDDDDDDDDDDGPIASSGGSG